MKIIDCHVHYLPEALNAPEILKAMDKAGVEKAFMLATPNHSRYVDCGLSGDNEKVAELVKAHPDRFVGGVYIDPRNVMEAQTTARKYRDMGFPVIKMWPAHGFLPDDPMIYPVWEVVNELKMAVLFHSGILGCGHNRKPPMELSTIRSAAFNSKFGQPIYLDQPARFFPDIQFIIAHCAYPWTLEALDVSFMHKNVYIDFSCPLGYEGYNLIDRLKPSRIAWDRMLFGSDTAGNAENDIERWKKLMDEPLFKDHKEAFFYDNAKSLLDKISR